MIDCGHSSEPVWYPSIAYHNKTINLLVVSNLDEDHISDLPGILAGGSQHGNLLSPSPAVKSIAYNQSVSPADLAAMKAADGMDEGVKRFHQWLTKIHNVERVEQDLGMIRIDNYYNDFPFGGDVTDSNNLSLVSVIRYGSFKMVACGDLEEPGWLKLIEDDQSGAFAAAISNAHALIAAHHGRESGFSLSALQLIKPTLVIFSDSHVQYDTQKTADLYNPWTSGTGVLHPIGGNKIRKVLTTRNDGHIQIFAGNTLLSGWSVATEKG